MLMRLGALVFGLHLNTRVGRAWGLAWAYSPAEVPMSYACAPSLGGESDPITSDAASIRPSLAPAIFLAFFTLKGVPFFARCTTVSDTPAARASRRWLQPVASKNRCTIVMSPYLRIHKFASSGIS